MSEHNLKLKIKAGLKIRDPKTMALMECEKTYSVPPSQYWMRRLRDGDCELVKSTVSKKKTQSNKKENKEKKQVETKVENKKESDQQEEK